MLIPAFAQLLLALAACSPGTEPTGRLIAEASRSGTSLLVVKVIGLPAGAAAAIVVTGPNAFSQVVVGTDTLSNLDPGTYTISSSSIVSPSGDGYTPSPLVQTVSISPGSHPSKRVTYALSSGSLQVSITGLPSGTPAAVTVTGPGGYSTPVAVTTTLRGLVPGSYTIVASSTTSTAGSTYSPSPLQQSALVSASLTPVVGSVAYSAATGALTLTATGLPSGVGPSLTVTGPAGFSRTLTALDSVTSSQTLTGLVAGTYTVAAASVTSGSTTYQPSPQTQSVSVSGGLTATATTTYSSTYGGLSVAIQGLPTGTPSSVTVTGPAGFSQLLAASQTLTGLAAGSYTVAAVGVNAAGYAWSPTPASQVLNVTAGALATASVTYAASTGSLAVSVTGLPTGTAASLSVTGPGGYTRLMTATGTLAGLAPGSYSVTASSVTGTSVYTPAPASQTASVTAGSTASAGVTYSTSGGGSSLDLTVSAAYLVQATQRLDGSVPLVAGRAAYLRVFAVANQANTAAPQVRVRLYSGSTLMQTYTLSAPAGSVPTSVDESSLTRSWNVLVPGTLIQPGLKVLADVDPAGSVAESNEGNNMFPASGTPAAVDVRALPTFAFRFVPVLQQVNGLQGNVTTANAESYLPDLKAMLPVGGYNADVRAVYTTTAPALDAGNSNGAWSTVISEIYALRGADASSRYYYGVVKTSYTSGVVGLGYVGGTAHTAVGWDGSMASNVLAHELGHNLSRQHAPCGGAGSPDPSYPYSGGVIGVWGLDPITLTLQSPSLGDVMSYCHPNWISDYNWSAMVGYRQSSPQNLQAQGAPGASGLLVWGRVTAAGVELEPAFKVAMGSDLLPRAGANRLELLGTDGTVLRTVSFATEELADLPGGPEQHFAFVLPLESQLEGALAGLRVRAGARTASRSVAGVPAAADPAQDLTRPNAEQVQLRWDASRYPMVMVRDAATGQVLSFARGGSARLWTRSGSFELIYSDGVRSLARQGRVLQ
jgi:CARDB protein